MMQAKQTTKQMSLKGAGHMSEDEEAVLLRSEHLPPLDSSSPDQPLTQPLTSPLASRGRQQAV